MEKNQKAMNAYVKALSKRNEGEDKDKLLAVGAMGQAMTRHGEEFEDDSEYGRCLVCESIPYRQVEVRANRR